MHTSCIDTLFDHFRASDKCQREKRKTINGDDLVWAMGILGFEEYGEPLKLYLHKYREVSALGAAQQPAVCCDLHSELLTCGLSAFPACMQGEKQSLAKQAAAGKKGGDS